MNGILDRLRRGLGLGRTPEAPPAPAGPDLRFAMAYGGGVLTLGASFPGVTPSTAEWRGPIPDPCAVPPERGDYVLHLTWPDHGLAFGPPGQPGRHRLVPFPAGTSPGEIVLGAAAIAFLETHVGRAKARLGREPDMTMSVTVFETRRTDDAGVGATDDFIGSGPSGTASDDDYARTMAEQEAAARLAGLGYAFATDDAHRRDGRVGPDAVPDGPTPPVPDAAGVTAGGDDGLDAGVFDTAGGDGRQGGSKDVSTGDFTTAGGDGGTTSAKAFETIGGDAWEPASGGYGR